MFCRRLTRSGLWARQKRVPRFWRSHSGRPGNPFVEGFVEVLNNQCSLAPWLRGAGLGSPFWDDWHGTKRFPKPRPTIWRRRRHPMTRRQGPQQAVSG